MRALNQCRSARCMYMHPFSLRWGLWPKDAVKSSKIEKSVSSLQWDKGLQCSGILSSSELEQVVQQLGSQSEVHCCCLWRLQAPFRESRMYPLQGATQRACFSLARSVLARCWQSIVMLLPLTRTFIFTVLREAGVDCLTLGQYMQPTKRHLKVNMPLIYRQNYGLYLAVKFFLSKMRLDLYPSLNCGCWEVFPSLSNFISIYYGLLARNGPSYNPSIFCRLPVATISWADSWGWGTILQNKSLSLYASNRTAPASSPLLTGRLALNGATSAAEVTIYSFCNLSRAWDCSVTLFHWNNLLMKRFVGLLCFFLLTWTKKVCAKGLFENRAKKMMKQQLFSYICFGK